MAVFDKDFAAKLTPRLMVAVLFMAFGNVIYGYDTGSFGGVQAIPAFGKQFGYFDETLKRYTLRAQMSSLLTSLAFVGKLVGTLVAGPCIESLGHKYGMVAVAIVTIVGTIVQITSKATGQFLAGRIIVYIGVGLIENVVPTYQSEIVPAAARGFFVGSLQMFLVCGSLVAAGVNRHFSTFTTDRGWQIPVGVQLIAPCIVLIGIWFIPDSPRWLIHKGRHEEAVMVLKSVRPKEDVDAGMCEAEADAIEEALRSAPEKGPWLDLFRGTNRRRTMIATVVFAFQQLTGQAFTSQYGTVFYIRVGLASMAFTYSLISTALSILMCLAGMYFLDIFGRRPVLIAGAAFQALWLYLVAGIGGAVNPSNAAKHMMVAATILFNFSFSISWAPLSYVVASEVGTAALREKTMAFSSAINVVCAFAVSFTLPYLLNPPYANLQAKVGYIYGSIAVLAMIAAIFLIPETKGRSLEELDELFENKVSVWTFGSYKSTGIGARITAMGRADGEAEIYENEKDSEEQAKSPSPV